MVGSSVSLTPMQSRKSMFSGGGSVIKLNVLVSIIEEEGQAGIIHQARLRSSSRCN